MANSSSDEAVKLLFFDTFPHAVNEELNLDLVQFPKPVYITEVRIIPLGARVKSDFAGGDRLGATNPSKFNVDFFVNDLGKPGSSFECLGSLDYNQNDCIHLECVKKDVRQIPTDGLVLRGWYTTITLAVYGTLTNGITESPPEEVLVIPVPVVQPSVVEKLPVEPDIIWQQPDVVVLPREEVFIEFVPKPFSPPFSQPHHVHHTDTPKDINRSFIRPQERIASSESDWDRDIEDEERIKLLQSSPVARAPSREISRPRDCNRGYSRSSSREREFLNRSKRDWSRSPDYRRSRRRTSSYERGNRDVSRERDKDHDVKRPRTPPMISPKRPRTPEQASSGDSADEVIFKGRRERKYSERSRSPDIELKSQTPSPLPIDLLVDSPDCVDDSSQGGVAFEPILSDEEINDDCEEQFDMMDYDDSECEEFIKCIDPTTTILEKFVEVKRLAKEVDLAKKIVHKYKLRDDAATSYNFDSLTAESKEAWVHCAENFIQMLQMIHNFAYSKRNEMLQVILNEHIKTLVDWVKMGLFFAMSQPQAVYKIRHIKVGARLIELLGCCHDFLTILLYKEKLNIFSELFDLYYQQNMALSIKLMIIKAIYACLDLKVGIDFFLCVSGTENGYQKLVRAIRANPLTRAKFALKATMKKVNLFESLELMRGTVNRICISNANLPMTESDLSLLEIILMDLIKSFTTGSIHFSQPKRYLPVSATFEIVKDLGSIRSTAATFQSFFGCHALLECILLLISRQHQLHSVILDLCLEMIKALVNSNCGLDYLYNKTDATGVLVKCLIGTVSDESQECMEDEIDSTNYKLGIEIVYKIKTKFFLDSILHITDDNELGETLNLFYSLTSNPIGRCHVVDTISMDNNVLILLDVIEREKKSDLAYQSSPGCKIKSPYIGYCVDLIDMTIRNASNIDYLEDCANILLNLCKNHLSFEPTISLVLQETAIYLKPLEIPNVFQYDDITELYELIKRSSEYVTNFPGELITSLRLIKRMAISNMDEEDDVDHVELKHKYVILKFYSSDGITMMVSILDKLNSYFEQPAVHMAALASNQGLLAVQIICPTVQILRKMLTYVIQSRNTQYKDVTVIEHLLKTFNLMHFVPAHSSAYSQAKTIQEQIIKILLAYTQPTPIQGLDTESVHKSLWTQMIGELAKHILSGPHTFISGLSAFSELLPLPLPVLTKFPLSEAEVTRLITERQLWSAHLHPKSVILTEVIQTICTASYPELLNILRRICIQLADLAPNMSLLVSKAITDLLIIEGSLTMPMTLRILRFLSTLIVEPTIKITVLSILPGKLFEVLVSALTLPSLSLKLQKCVYGLFDILLDAEVSLLSQPSIKLKSSTIACALPSKELLPTLTSLFVENFLKIGSDCSLYALNLMCKLTRYDYTLCLLRSALDKEKENILKTIAHLTSSIKIPTKQHFLSIFLDFLSALTITNTSVHRSFSLTASDVALILSWPTKNISELYHPLEQLKNAIEPIKNDNTLDNILYKLNNLFKILNSASPIDALDLIEPAFPLPEGIVVQYTERSIYQLIDKNTHTNEIIQSNYWLGYPSLLDKIDDDAELISCDLCELAKSSLPSETNITLDCKRLLHLTASPQSNRERTTAAPCFRTRRVEVEPTTGRPEKKIYVTRGRGFPRTPPTRGDLFRSRPPNTSRPPSLHVDDFLALETCGAQPTGPTGYNKLSRDIISIRGTRGRGRGFVDRGRASTMGGVSSPGPYRQTNRRTNSPSTWQSQMEATGPPQQIHYRTATAEPVGHFPSDYGVGLTLFGTPMRGGRVRGNIRPPRTFNRQ